MKYVVIDGRTPDAAISGLRARGFEPILLPCFDKLDAPVSAHPDMLIFFGDKLFCPNEYYSAAKKELDLISKIANLPICAADTELSPLYPNDVAFNSLRIGNFIFGKESCIAPKIKEYAAEAALKIVDVKQGYTKCSVCKVSENAIITSDRSIEKAAKNCGIDVLLVSSGHVKLKGYDCGFIGGASGSDGENVYFCGSLDSHPNGDAIRFFCKKHKKETVSLSDEPLYDIGTMFFI